MLLLLLAMLMAVVVPVLHWIRLEYHKAGTVKRLQCIALALSVYHESYDCYPPQYLTDSDGAPAHSWRVLILPFLGYGDLYDRYRFDEPWNGPHNRLLLPHMPGEYRSPFLDSDSTTTQYVGISGAHTPWQGERPLQEDDFPPSSVGSHIWFVEAANSDIAWMEPRDIPLEQALLGMSASPRKGIQSNYSDGLPVQLYPFGRELVPISISPNDLRHRLTIPKSDKRGVGVRRRKAEKGSE